ncbi:MAG: DEAD/DEAH box helicase [Acidimicrobiales bacterium]
MTFHGLSLDRFQRDAIDVVNRGDSVLVAAPTGAGKTVVADAAIDRVIASSRRAIYTTPIKALSNQKFHDLGRRLGSDSVGLLTGDRSIAPRAPVVVMTTEIVRALIDANSDLLAEVDLIVLDEFHYLRDPERGSVWEEIVIDAPAHLQLVCLSATMPDAPRVARWLNDIHPTTELVVEDERPVPLHHLYAIGNLQAHPPLLLPMYANGQINEVAVRHDGQRHDTRGEGRRVRDVKRPVAPDRPTLLTELRDRDLIPAIWFMLSRSGCERGVDELLDAGVSLNTPDEASRAGQLADAALGGLPPADQLAINPFRWRAALEHGLASHHGGLLPLQREATERAFADGLVKLVFATETLAVGVNLPARTTIIDRVTRPESQGGEVLRGDEFTQLAGRAGRRGLDPVGYSVVPWAPDIPFYRVAGLAGGTPALLESQLQCTPTMVASLAHRFDTTSGALNHLRRSLMAHLLGDRRALLEHERATGIDELTALEDSQLPPEKESDQPARPSELAAKADTSMGLAAVSAGQIIADPARPRALLVLAVRSGRRGLPALDVLGVDGRRLTVTPRDFRQPAVVVGSYPLDDWDPSRRGQAREAARGLVAMDRAGRFEVPRRAAAQVRPTDRAGDIARRDVERLRSQISAFTAEIEALATHLPAELEATRALLERRGHLSEFTPTRSGSLLRRIYHPQGLLVAETLGAGLFDGLDAPALAGLAACFRAGAGSRTLGRSTSSHRVVSERVRQVAALAAELNRDEASFDRPLTLLPDSLFVDAMVSWASGDGLGAALGGLDVLPGDFLRDVRQTIELLDQLRAATREGEAVHREAAAAMSLIDRDAARIGLLEEAVP